MAAIWPLQEERELWSDICTPGRHERSLWWFVKIAAGWEWRCTAKGGLPWLQERVHGPWLDWFQSKIMEWKALRAAGIHEPMKIANIAPRGHGKSQTITKAASLWSHLDEPNMSTCIGSATLPLAKAFLKPMKSIMDGSDPDSWFAWMYGNWYSPERDWNTEEVVHGARLSLAVSEPSFAVFGVETGITSKHPLEVFYDDPVTKEKLGESGTWFDTVADSIDSIFNALRADSLFVLTMTRYGDEDPFGTLIEQEGVATWTGHDSPEPYKTEGAWHVYYLQARDRNNVKNFPKGEPLLPEAGYTDKWLTNHEKRKSQEHSTQYMNDPSTGEHMEISVNQIEKMKIPRSTAPPIEYATVHIDTAFKDEGRRERGDYSTINVWLHDLRPNGIVYFDRCVRIKCRDEEFDQYLVRVLWDLKQRGYRVAALTDESEVGGKRGVYKQRLEQVILGAGLQLPEIYQFNRSGTKKDMRIREAAGYWLQGFVRLFDDAENLEFLIREMTHIGRTKYDDVSDPCADVFRPEVWRGRINNLVGMDDQPQMPIQPGDDVLKAQHARDLDALKRDIFGSNNFASPAESLPYESFGPPNDRFRY